MGLNKIETLNGFLNVTQTNYEQDRYPTGDVRSHRLCSPEVVQVYRLITHDGWSNPPVTEEDSNKVVDGGWIPFDILEYKQFEISIVHYSRMTNIIFLNGIGPEVTTIPPQEFVCWSKP